MGCELFRAKSTHKEVISRYADIEHPPLSSIDRRVINAIFLGQSPLYDNFIHLWSTQYLGDKQIIKTDPEKLFKEISKLLPRHIHSESFYLMTCFRFIFDFKRPELCEPVGKIGMKTHDTNWMIPATLAYSYLVSKRFSESAVFFEIASRIPNAPKYFSTVGKKILKKNNADFSLSSEILNELGKSNEAQLIIKKFTE